MPVNSWEDSAKTALPATKVVMTKADGTVQYIDIDTSSCATAMLVTVSATPTGAASDYSDISVIRAALGVQNIIDNIIGLASEDVGTFMVPVTGPSKLHVAA